MPRRIPVSANTGSPPRAAATRPCRRCHCAATAGERRPGRATSTGCRSCWARSMSWAASAARTSGGHRTQKSSSTPLAATTLTMHPAAVAAAPTASPSTRARVRSALSCRASAPSSSVLSMWSSLREGTGWPVGVGEPDLKGPEGASNGGRRCRVERDLQEGGGGGDIAGGPQRAEVVAHREVDVELTARTAYHLRCLPRVVDGAGQVTAVKQRGGVDQTAGQGVERVVNALSARTVS